MASMTESVDLSKLTEIQLRYMRQETLGYTNSDVLDVENPNGKNAQLHDEQVVREAGEFLRDLNAEFDRRGLSLR